MSINLDNLRRDFPILKSKINGYPLVYLDNAATSQKPNAVIEAVANYYRTSCANIHRGVHTLSDQSTRVYLDSKKKVADFFGAESQELILLKNTTQAINWLSLGWGERYIGQDDVIVVTQMEHHSNLVPWQELARRRQTKLICIDVNEKGELDLAQLEQVLKSSQVKLVTVTHISNVLGLVNPIDKIVDLVHRLAPVAKILIDGAQAAGHLPVNFAKLPVDFYALSAHKMLGPMGIGGLLVKKDLLKDLPPVFYGGGMIDQVSCQKSSYAEDNEDRFTAGTPDVAGIVGWAAACEYLEQVGWPVIQGHEQKLVDYLLEELAKLSGWIVAPHATSPLSLVSFYHPHIHAHDVAQVLDSIGVAVRSGHHCAMPLHRKFSWQATLRASFQVYNTLTEVDELVKGLKKAEEVFG